MSGKQAHAGFCVRPAPALALTALAIALVPASSSAQTNEVKPCGKDAGWEIAAGNFPPRFPKTSCAFAKATYRAAKARPRDLTKLPRRFRLSPGGDGISCKARSTQRYAEFRCKDDKSFVLAYSFR